jgi:hypothetical protein
MPAASVMTLVMAISAGTVTNSIGVNTHIDFKKYGYQNLATTAASINYLGVKNLRDCPGNASDLGANGGWQKIADATGAKFDAYMTEGSPASDMANLRFATLLAKQGILNFIEGGNENDDSYAVAQGNSLAWTANFQQQVFAAGRALNLPVINMSFGSGWTAANNWQGNYDKVGDLSPFADYANAHTYPNARQRTDQTIQRLNADAKLAARSHPVITTEIGWDDSKMSRADIARFALEAVLDGIKNGNHKTYFYALFDDNSGKFGLMNQDGSPKPAGTSLHNLTAILADKGTARPSSLAYGVSGGSGNDNSLLMSKSNGAFLLALWNETDAAHSVTLTLGETAGTIRLYDPLTGGSASQIAANTRSITVKIPDHPVIVEIVPGSAIGTPPGVTPPVN